MLTVFFRTFIIYIILIVAIRIMGKRQVGELQISELVVTFMLSDLAVIPISNKDIPVSHAVIPIVLLLSLEVILSFLQTKSVTVKKLLSGEAVPVIIRGKLDRKALEKNRIELDELLGELRLGGAFDIDDVEYAFLEENGKLSVLPKSDSSPVTPHILGIKSDEKGIAHTVITDGVIKYGELRACGRNSEWLKKFCSEKGYSAEEIFLLTVDDSGGVNMAVKDDTAPRGIGYEKHFTS